MSRVARIVLVGSFCRDGGEIIVVYTVLISRGRKQLMDVLVF